MSPKTGAYTNLPGEIKTLRNLNKVQITLIIVGAIGTFYKKFDDDISKLGLTNHKFQGEEAQKVASPGTARIIRSFLDPRQSRQGFYKFGPVRTSVCPSVRPSAMGIFRDGHF